MLNKIKINLKAIIGFIIAIGLSYLLIYILTPADFFKSPMYMLLPIVGFLGMFYFSKYIMDYVQIKNKYYLVIAFLVVGVVGYYLAIIFFYWNIAILNDIALKEILKHIFQNQSLLLKSAFLEFLISGAIGIIAHK
jgi:hypothetical protein